jgi:two-component system, LytTR family, sensor kinase
MRTVFIHAAGWTVFIFYEMTLLYYFSQHLGSIADNLIFYGLNIGLFYFHALVTLPAAFNSSKRYILLALFLLAEIFVYLILKFLVDYYAESFRVSPEQGLKISRYVFTNSWRGIYFIGFSTVYFIVVRLFRYRSEIARAENEQVLLLRDKAEVERNLAEVRNAYLQQQIRPHFLFNSLNFVYSAVYKHSAAASQCLLDLSDLLRYSFADPDATGRAPLEAEAEQINKLLAINRLRFDQGLFIVFDCRGDLAHSTIIPLVLLTFAENVFKHGSLKNKDHPARIALSLDDDRRLTFETWNLKRRNRGPEIKTTGIQNAIKRLEFAYGERYDLKITDQPESFQLNLTIQL